MRDIVLTAIIFGLLPVCVMRPWIGILAWYWLGLMNPHMFTWGFARTMPFAMMIAVATLIGTLIARDRKSIPWNRELVLVAMFMGYVTFTNFFAWEPAAAWAYWEQFGKILLMTFVATMLIYGKDRIRALMLVIGASFAFYGIKGAVFTIRGGGIHNVQGPEGVFIGGNTFLGLALNMAIPVLVALARDEQNRKLKYFLNFSAACCVISSVFTYSRGALLGLAVVLPLLLLRDPRKAWGGMIFLIAAGYLVITIAPERLWQRAETIQTYEEDGSAMARLRSWSVAWNIAKDRPITGAGFQYEYSPNRARWFSYQDERFQDLGGGTQSAHSAFFQVLGQHGFVGLGIYLFLMASALLHLTRLRRQARALPDTGWIATYADGLRIGIIAFAISGAFLNVAYFDLYYIYIAMTAILARELKTVLQPATAATARPVPAVGAPAGILQSERRS
ncbi:MAG: putative O-glycosylation ligase, exosortase A system-associated [Burkholderiales bacterium]|nr:putative O-glycosylation ligase, exosortase A system-associated [Burkholderiales bacterium]